MDLTLKNTYQLADGSATNVESLMECTDEQRLSLDEMSFGEFSTTNVPTLRKGSRATVNGALFGPAAADGVPLYIANASGSTFQDASAAPIGTKLYLCLIPSAPTSVTYALKACAAVEYDAERRGFYEVGTQNRVFGECQKVSSSVYPTSYKRRYFSPSIIETYLKTYSDGLEINARKLSTINKVGLVASSVMTVNKNANQQTAKTTLFKIRVDYPLVLHLQTNAKTWTEGGQSVKIISGCSFIATLMDAAGTTEVGGLPAAVIEDVPSSSGSSATVDTLINLLPGTYNIKLKTVVASFSESPVGGGPALSYQYGIWVGAIIANIRNVFGDRTGSWGAIL